ncbi:DNA-directed RNA polymerase, beta' subunit [Neorickettsia helminthoeca str. Oregon]|uniref:DNA-directed RNA polymerase subunit beta' n=1 Tax=Neorickettsia helminthoeca str. Oregon TaxID=1286528 RepID=X5HM99_9RICK|nr:DNA-directed RNA polymerase subunit beta' [Neorickettsia helminthoeca]AHX11575.1 DNA-directed RNA polymerase, beta' subunit [Neorickettsia helminthoeca str. Oregon]
MKNFSSFHRSADGSVDFDSIKISLASADKIRALSYGEVTKPETINYRTFKPERDGLFCAKIFGPTKSYECLCGKYKKIKYSGVVCERCGVEVTSSRVRRERMGHIELASPVAHIWFLKSLPSKICTLLDLTLKNVEKILYFESYVVIDPGVTAFNKNDIITDESYSEAIREYGAGSFTAMIGAEAIKHMLASLNLEEMAVKLRSQAASTNSEVKKKKIIKTLRLVEQFLGSDSRPVDMILDVIPVMPPDLRPLVMLDGGRFATSDLNALYRSVINRNNRLKSLIYLRAPSIIINNERRMLQEAVDALFDNGRRTKIIKGSNKRPYKSISDMLKGKQGRFRQNLLGKRVDYSGRSVIVVGPALELHQCGLPKKIALELFKPFIYSKLELYGIAPTIKTARRMVQNEQPEVWDVLAKVIHQHPVFLNRAPTLHRLSVQAFEPVLIEGKAIQLHPLVCTAFNADFDGDQMSVHVPLSIEAQVEARLLVMSTNNILNPANSRPIIVPSKDIVLGVYYLSLEEKSQEVHPTVFCAPWEAEHAFVNKKIALHTRIRCQLEFNGESRLYTTTFGRLQLLKILPEGVPFDSVNTMLTVRDISNLVDLVYKICGHGKTVEFADKIMELGFRYATLSGISFGKDDMVVPATKAEHVRKTNEEVKDYEFQYQEGLITKHEKYNKVVDAWQKCTDIVAKDMMEGISVYENVAEMNSIFMMAQSGARGSAAQIKQLAGMRGLMAKPSGEIIPNPIISNLREGQGVLEYFNSTHGARKGLADTALKTANSGYLTRRLVDVAQDSIIVEEDCGATDGLMVRASIEGGVVIMPLSDSIFSRVSAGDIVDPSDGSTIVRAGEMFDDASIERIESLGIDSVRIRSVLTCKSKYGICRKCYGADLSNRKLVSLGEAVGVIAAQSVGEPGTQLTMRTFHVGGAATRRVESSSMVAFCSGRVKFVNANLITNRDGNYIVLSRSFELLLVDSLGIEHFQGRVQYGGTVYVKEGDMVPIGKKLADWDLYTVPIISEASGKVSYADMIEGVSYNEIQDENTGISNKTVVDWKQGEAASNLRPRVEILNADGSLATGQQSKEAIYLLPLGAILNVSPEDMVEAGDIIAKITKESTTTRDITGGLPRVIKLFEARKGKVNAVISEVDGYVEFAKDYYKSKRKVLIRSREDSQRVYEYLVPKGRHLIVSEGDFIRKGEPLMDGDPDLHEILRVLGLEALAEYMITEIQRVYRLQGVKINNKHIEVIIRKMLQKVEITDAGDTTLLVGEQVEKSRVEKINEVIATQGLRCASYTPVLLGITRASLQTESFISAASFQETTKILTEAAVAGKVDRLRGLKENIIAGRLLPVGAGYFIDKLRHQFASEEQHGQASVELGDDIASV